MNQLHPVFDDILQSFVAPPPPRPKSRRFEVTVIADGQPHVVQTKALSVADAILNAVEHYGDAGRLTVVARPRGE